MPQAISASSCISFRLGHWVNLDEGDAMKVNPQILLFDEGDATHSKQKWGAKLGHPEEGLVVLLVESQRKTERGREMYKTATACLHLTVSTRRTSQACGARVAQPRPARPDDGKYDGS